MTLKENLKRTPLKGSQILTYLPTPQAFPFDYFRYANVSHFGGRKNDARKKKKSNF